MAQTKSAGNALHSELKKIGRLVGRPKATKQLKLGIREIDGSLVGPLATGWDALPYALRPGEDSQLLTVRRSLLVSGKSAKKTSKSKKRPKSRKRGASS